MSFEEEFDGIIKRKAEGAEVPFNEADWANAAKLIDASRKGGWLAGKKILTVAVALLLVGTGIAAYTLIAGQDSQIAEQAQPAVTVNAATISVSTPAVSDQQNNTTLPATTHQAGSENASEIVNTTGNDIPANRPAVVSASKQNPVLQGSPDAPGVNGESVTKTMPANDNKSEKANPSLPGTPVLNGGTPPPAADPVAKQENPSVPAVKATIEPVIIPATPAQATEVPAILNASSGEIQNEVEFVNLDGFAPAYGSAIGEANGKFNFLQENDQEYYEKNGKRKIHYLLADAGGAYSMGWDVPSAAKDAVGINWYAGLTYGRYISRRASISLGIQGFNLSNIVNPFYSFNNINYDFYFKSTTTNVAANQLYFVGLPLKFNYTICHKHQLSAGINPSWLLYAENTIKTMPLGGSDDIAITTQNTGVYDGLNQLNFAISAGYRFNVCRNWALGGEAYYNFTDIFANNRFAQRNESPMFLRVGVTYTFFDK